MGDYWTTVAPEEANQTAKVDKATNLRVASFINSRTGVTGAIYPKTYRPCRAVFWHYKQWREAGLLEQIMTTLHGKVREHGKKNQSGQPYWSSTSLALKNTCNAGVESKGFCDYKCINGIKRHLAVDTLGLPFFTHCTPAVCEWWRWLDWTIEPELGLLSCQACEHPKDYNCAQATATTRTRSQPPCKHSILGLWLRSDSNWQPNPRKPKKPPKAKRGLSRSQLVGWLNARMRVWNDVKVWSRTLSEHWLMQLPSLIYVLSDSCSSG